MKAIILSAGRGKRLLPLTKDRPKCLLPVADARPILDVQLRVLATCGVHDVTVVVGFGADHVEHHLQTHPVPGLRVRTLFNPFYDCADNLASCWLAGVEMYEDFVLMNGDTLFEPAVLERLLRSSHAPLTLAISEKDAYDGDDMKVSLSPDGRLAGVSKRLDPVRVDAESIGLMVFRGDGPKRFRHALDRAVREPSLLQAYYLAVIERLAERMAVEVAPITGLWWAEVDDAVDLAHVRLALGEASSRPGEPPTGRSPCASGS